MKEELTRLASSEDPAATPLVGAEIDTGESIDEAARHARLAWLRPVTLAVTT